MSEHTIQKLQEVLNGTIKGRKIVDTKITNLTAPGENFGSMMLKVDLTLKNEDGSEEDIHAVAKQIPANDFAKDLFNIQVTFKNEIAMYDTIAPTLRNFQKENGVKKLIDCFPELYGSRINLGEQNGTVDENGVLILENLIFKGYEVVDRHTCFDLETTELILKDLAAFHAVPLALKLKKPEVFDKKIRPFLAMFVPPMNPHEEEENAMVIEILQDSYKCIPWIPKIKSIFKNAREVRREPAREPFSTMTHGDLWVNNTMIKFQNGIPISNKLVDFQICDYRAPASDVFFFLFTSVQLRVLRDNLDDLMKFYHKHFISHLEALKCDTTPFSYPKFLEEMKTTTAAEIRHTVIMLLFVVFGKKGGNSKDFDPDQPPNYKKMKESLSLEALEKTRFIIQTCGERGWLN